MFKFYVFVLAVVGSASFAADKPIVESIQGATSVSVTAKKGVTREVEEGDALKVGDRVKTGSSVSVRVLHSDGSQTLIGRASDVEIEAPTRTTVWVRLHKGQVRSVVAKPKMKPAKNTYRYGIRTRAAVMGVRGTDFVVDHDDAGSSSEVHTLDGAVDVAQDDKALSSGKGQSVSRDQFTRAKLGEAIAQPQKFDRQKFLDDFKARQPDFEGMVNKAPRSPEELKKARAQAAQEAVEKARAVEKAKQAPPHLAPPPKKPKGFPGH